MKPKILTIGFVILVSSCATLFNKKYYPIEVSSTPDHLKIKVNDTSYLTPATLTVKRSKSDLTLVAKNDSSEQTLSIKKHLSPYFWANFGWMFYSPVFFAVDFTNDKRFSYGNRIHLNLSDANHLTYTYDFVETRRKVKVPPGRPCEKGQFFLKLSIPEGNSFYIRNKTNDANYWGFLGITSEVGYFYKKNTYVSIGTGALIDFIIPVPAPYDFEGEHESASALYFDVNHGHQFGRFSIGYGLNLSKNVFRHSYRTYYNKSDSLNPIPRDTAFYSIRDNRIGFSITTKMKITRIFQVGIKYLPSFYNIEKWDKLNYSHVLFLDIIFNIDINRKNR